MLFSIVPCFDTKLNTKMYYVKSNNYKQHHTSPKKKLVRNDAIDEYSDVVIDNFPIDLLRFTRPDELSGITSVFIPINTEVLTKNYVKDLLQEYVEFTSNIVIVVDNNFCDTEFALDKLTEIKKLKFPIALNHMKDYSNYKNLLEYVDYAILDEKFSNPSEDRQFLLSHFPNIKTLVVDLETDKDFNKNKKCDFDFYEGGFYRFPMTSGRHTIAPIKYNYIRLLNIANTENFEISDVAGVAQQDTAIALSLLKMVNRLGFVSEIRSISHAAAMLGQAELRQWITTAIAQLMYQDKPSEITRLSLIRGKFAENLAASFELSMFGKELFLMGLFSVLDIVFDQPIEQSLKEIRMPANVEQALISQKGPFADVIKFIKHYENGEWKEVIDLTERLELDVHHISSAYIDALKWYQKVLYGVRG